MDNRASLTISDFFNACGIPAPANVEEYNVYKKLVNTYIRDKKIPISEAMNSSFNFPISVLRKVLLNPTDKVTVVSTKTFLELPNPDACFIHLEVRENASEHDSDLIIIHINGDKLLITLVDGVGMSNIYNHELMESVGDQTYKTLIKFHPKGKLTYRFKVVWLRKFINYLRCHTDELDKCEAIEEWIVGLNIHKAPMSMTIDKNDVLRIKIKPNDSDTETLELDWKIDSFLGLIKKFNTQQQEIHNEQ